MLRFGQLILVPVLYFVVTSLIYHVCLRSAFIWDDQFLINKNSFIRSPLLIVEAFRHFLAEDPVSNFFRPVQTVTYIFDYWRGGLDPAVYRQTNYLIHGLNGGLIFLFITLTLKRYSLPQKTVWGAGIFCSLIWVVHPIHSATVAYISGRADSLALLFLLLGWCCWERRRQSAGSYRWLWTTSTIISGFLASCSKEAALVGIGFFLLFEGFCRREAPREERWKIIFGCILVGFFYLLLRSAASGISEPTNPPPGWIDRPNLVLRALGDYLRLLVFPSNLRMERQIVHLSYLYVDPATFDPVFPFLAIFGIVFIGILAFSSIKKGKYLALRRFGVLWFVLAILPVSNIFALNATVAEHWLYIPSVGLLVALLGWWLESGKRTQLNVAAICCFAIIAFSMRTLSRAEDWTSPITLFRATIRAGGDTPRMRVNLADEYRLAGKLKEGEIILRDVLQRTPKYSQARHSLMVNLIAQGRADEAEKLVLAGDEPFGDSFRGKLYTIDNLLRRGNFAACAAKLKQLRQLYPDSWLLTLEMGVLLDKLGRSDEKTKLVENFCANHWWHLASRQELVRIYSTYTTRSSDEIRTLLEISRLDIRNVSALNRASDLLARNRSFNEALSLQEKAFRRDPEPLQQERLAVLKKTASAK